MRQCVINLMLDHIDHLSKTHPVKELAVTAVSILIFPHFHSQSVLVQVQIFPVECERYASLKEVRRKAQETGGQYIEEVFCSSMFNGGDVSCLFCHSAESLCLQAAIARGEALPCQGVNCSHPHVMASSVASPTQPPKVRSTKTFAQ